METKEERIIKLFGTLVCLEGKLNPQVSTHNLVEKIYKNFKKEGLF